ncbi:MAG: hypothetical protein NT031_20025 [Planctomycetota bacterium]|nr:hypothetical protein [Planctomycetota bacterium]
MPTPDLILIGLCIAATAVALWATLAMRKQKKNTRRTDELELSMEAVARDVAVAYETLSGDIAQIRQETAQAVQGEQEKIASLINGLGTATNQVLRELAGAQEAQATAAEEARALLTARQGDLTALVTGLDARMAELTAAMAAQTARRVPKKPDPAPPQAPEVQPVEERFEELPEEPQVEPAEPEPIRPPAREPVGKRLPAPRKAVGKKSVRKHPR